MQDAFAFEVYVIDKGETSLRRSLQSLELLLHIRSINRRRFIQHLRQRALSPRNEEFSLKIDCIDKKLA